MAEGSDVVFVLGTRPEIIKLAPVIRACERRSISFAIVHTGQHYDDELDAVFFDQLDLPAPDYNLGVGSDSHATQTGAMLQGLDPILDEEKPNIVLVQGDTNSVLAGAIAASKRETDVGHVEAGLRSYNEHMPEEVNRRVADHVADLLFAPTETAVDILAGEDVDSDKIHLTGNTVVDAVQSNTAIARAESTVHDDLRIEPGNYAVLTAHRAETVDDEERFRGLLKGVDTFATETGLPVIYPIHPNPAARLDAMDFPVPESIRLVDPLDYLDFLRLQEDARIVFTDSGGVQEEACILGVPCVTLRDETERPETVEVGANVLAGTDPDRIEMVARDIDGTEPDWENPFGDGTSAEQIVDIIEREYDA
jgi:UDP-N-acetylglucosamine 2-epimerase (non-hydrolysing)